MLVLTRKSGESIRIGNNITITVLDNSSSQIKLGIQAPTDIPIHRSEVYERIQQENRQAVLSGTVQPQMLKDLFKTDPPPGTP